MEHFLILIVSIGISIWLFYKYKESQIKLKSIISKNISLKLENSSMKTKIKYLETYKTDVSKTFKILDDELLLIKDNLTQQQPSQIQHLPQNRVSLLTPSVLTSLMSNESLQVQDQPRQPRQVQPRQVQPQQVNEHELQPSQDVFNNIFNRFLTSNISNNDIELLRQQDTTNQQFTEQHQLPQLRQEIYNPIQNEEIHQEIQREKLESIKEEENEHVLDEQQSEGSGLIYSQNSYSKYLM